MKLLEKNYGIENIVHVEWHVSQSLNNPDATAIANYYGVGGVPELNLPDGLHPTAEGHRRIAERVAPALGALLGRIER